MSEAVIVALITGGLSLLGVIISNFIANNKVQQSIEKNQAVFNVQIEELTREVRLHNNFAQRVPILEEKISTLEKQLQK